ncbi:hypothetical protein PPACK8108_LOCUS5006 [Phakopsora pachyrhizi]|uniref:Uncharacterized protein n=1 Tax=Phakopsora pachyrhizi TaxID=170000 RepID=A0AAV0ANF4_PHAPC|nr:hypothetical protein PPACK8108_LOCUS5006 [Phakopsora pachyrhizi]
MQLVTQSLGFSDMGRLYEIYAAHIAFERGIRNDTRHDTRKAEIMQTHLLGAGSHFYLNDRLEALSSCCFPRIVAKILAQKFATLSPTEPVSDTSFFDKPVEALIKQCDVDKEITRIETSAVNHSIRNIQSEQSASYFAEFLLQKFQDHCIEKAAHRSQRRIIKISMNQLLGFTTSTQPNHTPNPN